MPNFTDKYHLTQEQNIFLAKKKWDENVYCGMRMENRAITFPQTKTILNGVNVPNVQIDDIQAVLNMRDAWKYLLSTISEPITLDYLCKLNEYIARNEALGNRCTGIKCNFECRYHCHRKSLKRLSVGCKMSTVLGRK